MSSLELHAADLARDISKTRERATFLHDASSPVIRVEVQSIMDELERFGALANALFTTYELLEIVLLHLPIHDLLKARVVDKTFLAVIGRSQELQRLLYLRTDTAQGPSHELPILNKTFNSRTRPQLGPWRLLKYGYRSVGDGIYDLALYYDLNDDTYSRSKALALCDGITNPGLWQNMYLTRPVCRSIEVVLRHRNSPQPVVARTIILDAEVTMDDVQSALQVMYNQTVASANWRDHIDHTHTFTKNKHC
ncbi:hypothetical protein LTR56_015797 [Elasticomyces elasticus]|nr:hypothetical protein LTR56_015797 [Elasticomyces elasticus]KAK3644081.1 hypothetical protein LTR22_015403 [Elasticomyces elasticus]KAK4922005.1 hypothetical protein LTR49_010590 [Elasticomyces elasticus]KAK5768814.1 hypothetical protein LTS12_000874 [Elasticomyces elasticus]